MQNEDSRETKIIMSKNPINEYSNQETKTHMEIITAHQQKESDSVKESIKIQFLQEEAKPKKEESEDHEQRTSAAEEERSCSGRKRLKRHRVEMAGRVWIPDMWGQEDLLKDWIDCTAFDASLVGSSIMSARAALMEEGVRTNPCTRLQIIKNGC